MIELGLTEPEILYGQRSFPDSQRLLQPVRVAVVGSYVIGWHDTSVQPYRGAFAVVDETDPDLEDLVGEVLRINAHQQQVLVYVLGRANVPTSISLTRRAFLALSGLWRDDLPGLAWKVIE